MLDFLVVALGESLLIGIYRDGLLIEQVDKKAHASEFLPLAYEELSSRYCFDRLLYANGPGSFMGIKISYIFLKSISIVKDVPLLAIDAFYFNDNRAIKAYGKLYFIKEDNKITLKPLDGENLNIFTLPQNIDIAKFSDNALPYYGLDAV